MAPTTYRYRCMNLLGSLFDMNRDLTDEELIALGRRHLAEKTLKDWGDLRRGAIAEKEECERRIKLQLADMLEQGQIGYATGGLKEEEVVEILQVDRGTVRRWIGKPRKASEKPATGDPELSANLS